MESQVGLNGKGKGIDLCPEFKKLNEISHCLLCLSNLYSNYIVISQYCHLKLGESWRHLSIEKCSFVRAEKID